VKRHDLLFVTVCTLTVLASMAVIAFSLYERKNTLTQTNHEVCVAIQNINQVVTKQLLRSKANLPKIAYFRQHPAELQDQLGTINQQLRDFKPREC
jgi:hypothetical protein